MFCPGLCAPQKEYIFLTLKVVTLSLDNCKKMGLVFDDVVGIVEMINCKDVKVQVRMLAHSAHSWHILWLLIAMYLKFSCACRFWARYQQSPSTRLMAAMCT